MLHEIFLSLLGYTGDLIIDRRDHRKSLGVRFPDDDEDEDEDEPTFKLAPDISFLQPSERYSKSLTLDRFLVRITQNLVQLRSIWIDFHRLVCEFRDIIERITALGFYYRELDRYATESRNLSWTRSGDASPLAAITEFSRGKAGRQSVFFTLSRDCWLRLFPFWLRSLRDSTRLALDCEGLITVCVFLVQSFGFWNVFVMLWIFWFFRV